MGRLVEQGSHASEARITHGSRILTLPWLYLMAVAVMSTSAAPVYGQTSPPDEARPAFNFGLGLQSGGEYLKKIEAAYGEGNVSGFGGWVTMHAGFEIPTVPRFSVVPDLRWMFSRISYESIFGLPASEKFNSLFSGRVGARFRPVRRRTGPYLQGSVGVFAASSDLSRLEFTAKNPALGVGVGVTVREYEFELSYERLRVETRSAGGAPPLAGDGTAENFGGIGFLFTRRVSL